MKQGKTWLFSAILLCLGGCSTDKDDPLADQPLESLRSQGQLALKEKKYAKAAKFFDEIERQYPYSDGATQAQLMAAYCYYLAQKYVDALAGLEVFVQLHPSHKDSAYAYYLMGLCHYEQISTVERDQKVTEMAVDAFQELIRRFPDSSYAQDARYKMDLLLDVLAAKEMQTGRYYQGRRAYSGALNRYKMVIAYYQTTSHVEEALHRLVETYMTLGLPREARKAAVVLGHNYPESPWYAETYALLSKEKQLPQGDSADDEWLKNLKLPKRGARPSIQSDGPVSLAPPTEVLDAADGTQSTEVPMDLPLEEAA